MTDTGDGGLHELTDMDTDKVDLVDRGANGLEFLVVKREEDVSQTSKRSKLGDYLREQMEAKDVSTAQMASAGGIEESTMNSILSGDIMRPPDRRLRGFARALGVSFETVLNQLPADMREQDDTEKGNATTANNEDTMDKNEMAKGLGFESAEAAEKIVAENAELRKRADDAEEAAKAAKAKADEIAEKAEAQAKTSKGLADRVQQLEKQRLDEKKSALRKSLVDAGKLPQSMHEWFDGLDYQAAKAFGETAPIVQAGRSAPAVGAPSGPNSMSFIEKRIAASLGGISAEGFVATRKAMADEKEEFAALAKFQDTGYQSPAAPQEG